MQCPSTDYPAHTPITGFTQVNTGGLQFSQISVLSKSEAWGVATSTGIAYHWINGNWVNSNSPFLTNVSAAHDGTVVGCSSGVTGGTGIVYILNNNNGIWEATGPNSQNIPFMYVNTGGAKRIWALHDVTVADTPSTNNIWYLVGTEWVNEAGGCTDIQWGPDGSQWVVNSYSQVGQVSSEAHFPPSDADWTAMFNNNVYQLTHLCIISNCYIIGLYDGKVREYDNLALVQTPVQPSTTPVAISCNSDLTTWIVDSSGDIWSATH